MVSVTCPILWFYLENPLIHPLEMDLMAQQKPDSFYSVITVDFACDIPVFRVFSWVCGRIAYIETYLTLIIKYSPAFR